MDGKRLGPGLRAAAHAVLGRARMLRLPRPDGRNGGGHRGLSHSLVFAVMAALTMTPLFFAGPDFEGLRLRIGVYVFVVTASHGVFDAMTNGGLGVAFFSPFDTTRYFLPMRPVEVSPIGISAFFTARSLGVLASEVVWIGLPWTLLVLLVRALVRATVRRRESENDRLA